MEDQMKISRLFLICIIFSLYGCASTKITGYSDPAYTSKTYQSTVVFASNVGLEKAAELEGAICKNFEAKGIKCSPFQLIFPPTRQHSADSVFDIIREKGFDSILILTAGGDYSSSQVFGYQSYGNATAYGNQAYGQASSYALRSYSRQSNIRAVLVDGASRETAWLGDAKTEGQGMANVTDSAFNFSVSNKITSTLLAISHFGSE
jgi:hypothetical protein